MLRVNLEHLALGCSVLVLHLSLESLKEQSRSYGKRK